MAELKSKERARLETARAAGLFVELDDARIASLIESGEVSTSANDTLAELVESYLSGEPRELRLRAPRSARDLIALLPTLAITVRDDPDGRCVHLVHDEDDGQRGTLFAPESHHAWVGVFNAALASAGDARTFVALAVRNHEEPLYLLVSAAQRDALASIALLAPDHDEVEPPECIPPAARAKQLAEALARRGVSAHGADERVELTLDLASATALLERLRATPTRDTRPGEHASRALERVP